MKTSSSILDYKHLNVIPISENKSRNKLFNRYFIDHLTNLPNIYQLRNDLEAKDAYSLIIFNIDNIQSIKNFYGYIVEDYIIEELGEYLKNYIPTNKTYRISDHEFAFIVDKRMYFYDLKALLETMYDDMKDMTVTYQEYQIYIDFTLASSSSTTTNNIFSKVYMALKYAQETRYPFWIYEDNMKCEESSKHYMQLTCTIREAVSNLRVIPYFQAIVDTTTLNIKKYECLARLIDSKGEIIPPLTFIPISKKLKNYSTVTKIIIDKSFAHFETVEHDFTINLAFEDIIKKEMFEFIINKLRNSNIAHKVTFEILESDAIEDFVKVERFIKEIRRYGAKIAIDDFGSGYSNFSYLTKLHIDYIKIDGSLVREMDTDRNALIVVETIVQFAQRLGIKTVAEYVHSLAVLERVRDLKIDYAQGFHLGEPTIIT